MELILGKSKFSNFDKKSRSNSKYFVDPKQNLPCLRRLSAVHYLEGETNPLVEMI